MKENLSSVYSPRQYMVSKDYEIYYYSDSAMHNVEDHVHNYYEYYFFLGGVVSIFIEDKEYPLSEGDLIIIPPGTKHHLSVLDNSVPYQRCIFWISQEFCDRLLSLGRDFVYPLQQVAVSKKYIYHFDVFTFNEMQTQLFRIIREKRGNRFGSKTKVDISVYDLIFSVSRNVYELNNPQKAEGHYSLYENLIAYIDEHITEPLTLDEIAENFFISKYHASHVFKDNLGLSLHQYIIKKRLIMCTNAMVSGTSISEAYLMCGFKDYSSFYRAFLKEYGISPKDYLLQEKV